MKRFDLKFLELAFAMLLLSMTPEKRKDLKDGDHVWDRLTKKKIRGWDFISIMFWVPCSPAGCISVFGFIRCVPIKGDLSLDFFLGYRRNGKRKEKEKNPQDQLIHQLP